MKQHLCIALIMYPVASLAQTVPGHEVQLYANVPEPMRLSFGNNGLLVTGRDTNPTGGGGTALSPWLIQPCGSSYTSFTSVVTDPDAVIVDRTGTATGVVGAILVGGFISGSTGRISMYAPNGTLTILNSSTLQTNPSDFVFDPTDGKLLDADYNQNRLWKHTTWTSGSSLHTHSGLAFVAKDPAGNLYTGNPSGLILKRSGGGTTTLINLGASASVPIGHPGSTGPFAGFLYALQGGSLWRIDTTAGTKTAVGSGFASNYQDIEFGDDGRMYISDWPGDKVLRITPTGGATVTGRIVFNDYVASMPTSADLDFYRPTDHALLFSHTVALDSNGEFSLNIAQEGCYAISTKQRTWLRQEQLWGVMSGMIQWSMVNGDVDDDNEVGPGDFSQLTAAFGSVDGDANWNPMADLDGDEEVGPSDFAVLSANFGTSGD